MLHFGILTRFEPRHKTKNTYSQHVSKPHPLTGDTIMRTVFLGFLISLFSWVNLTGTTFAETTEHASSHADVEGLDDLELALTNELEANSGACRRFSGRPRACERQRNCRYNFRRDVCRSINISQPIGRQCFRFDSRPRACERAGCTFRYRTDRCVRGGGIGNRPPIGGAQCPRFDNRPRRCNNTPGCFYNRRFQICQRGR